MPPKMKKPDIEKIVANYDSIIASLTKMSVKVKPVMPLASSSIALTIDIIEVYKQAFNATVAKQ